MALIPKLPTSPKISAIGKIVPVKMPKMATLPKFNKVINTLNTMQPKAPNLSQFSGPMTTAMSKMQGRLKAGAGSPKKKVLKAAISKVKKAK